MKKHIQTQLKDTKTLNEVCTQMNKAFTEAKKGSRSDRVGYVAGIIYSDGPQFVDRNVQILRNHTETVRNHYPFPIFSAVDIFYEGLFEKIQETKLPYDHRRTLFLQFWRDILSCGHVTDIFMTPRWEESEGASDEHTTAKKIGIMIHYLLSVSLHT